MPTTAGFTGTELKNLVKDWIGNQSSEFDSLIESYLPVAEYWFCSQHDWSFLAKRNLSLTVSSGTSEYSLTTANIGYEMQATNVKSVFSQANNRYLIKTTLEKIRLQDPDINDGTTSTEITHWAAVGDKDVIFYPSNFKDTTLKIDGKIEPAAFLTLSNTSSIPFRYQNTMLTYLLALVLDRENDTRSQAKFQEAMLLVRQNILDDMAHLGGQDMPRVKSMDELTAPGHSLNDYDALNLSRS